MYRTPLLALLDRYQEAWPDERACVERIRALVRGHADCFERSCLPGHVTGSAWVVSADHQRVLLTHHAKLDRWLQLGGHADGDGDVRRVALREAQEESGMQDLSEPGAFGPDDATARLNAPLPLDVDVHLIPARADEPAHEHHDVRYLLVAAAGQQPRRSSESKALAWFSWERIEREIFEESLIRMAQKARERLGV